MTCAGRNHARRGLVRSLARPDRARSGASGRRLLRLADWLTPGGVGFCNRPERQPRGRRRPECRICSRGVVVTHGAGQPLRLREQRCGGLCRGGRRDKWPRRLCPLAHRAGLRLHRPRRRGGRVALRPKGRRPGATVARTLAAPGSSASADHLDRGETWIPRARGWDARDWRDPAASAPGNRDLSFVTAVLDSHGVVVLRVVLDGDPARAHTVALPLQAALPAQADARSEIKCEQ